MLHDYSDLVVNFPVIKNQCALVIGPVCHPAGETRTVKSDF